MGGIIRGLRSAGIVLVLAAACTGARAGASAPIAPPIGKAAPDFALKSLSGENLRLSEFMGQIVLLNFWGTWSGPTRQEMPQLQKLHSTYRSAGLVILGVNLDEDPRRATEYVQTLKVSYPILLDTRKTIGPLYSLAEIPMTLLIDRAGIVRYVHHGYTPGAEEEYLLELRTLLDE